MAPILLFCILSLLVGSHAEVDFGQQKCGDPKCESPVSIARTTIRYSANDNHLLSFNKNEEVVVLSKSDDNPYWGVMINDRRGFVNKVHLQERTILSRSLSFDWSGNKKLAVEEVPVTEASQAPRTTEASADVTEQPPPAKATELLPSSLGEATTITPSPDEETESMPATATMEESVIIESKDNFATDQVAAHSKESAAESQGTVQGANSVTTEGPQVHDANDVGGHGHFHYTGLHSHHHHRHSHDHHGHVHEEVPTDSVTAEANTLYPAMAETDNPYPLATDETNNLYNPDYNNPKLGAAQPNDQYPESPNAYAHDQVDHHLYPETPAVQAHDHGDHHYDYTDNHGADNTFAQVNNLSPQDSYESEVDVAAADQLVTTESSADSLVNNDVNINQSNNTESFVDNSINDGLVSKESNNVGDNISNPDASKSATTLSVDKKSEMSSESLGHEDSSNNFSDGTSDDQSPLEGSVVDATVQHYIESSKDFVPEWLHKSFHGQRIESFSPRLVSLLCIISLVLVAIFIISLVFNKLDRESLLKGKLAEADRLLFKARNEALILRREMDVAKKAGGSFIAAAAGTTSLLPEHAANEVQLYKELELLKSSHEQIIHEAQGYKTEMELLAAQRNETQQQNKQLTSKIEALENCNEKLKKDIADYESVVQECLEEKKRMKDQMFSGGDLHQVVETLRVQLNSQKEKIQRYEGRVKKREAELKERTQEVRKLRADVANANLKSEKVLSEKLKMEKESSESGSLMEQLRAEICILKSKLSDLEAVQNDMIRMKEELELKDTEMEETTRENQVLKETIRALKASVAKSSSKMASNNNHISKETSEEAGEGWDGFDNEVIMDNDNDADDFIAVTDVDFAEIESAAQLTVDLKKAQAACEQLMDQLTKAEQQRDQFETQLKDQLDELEMSHAAKEEALKERTEIEKKHDVLKAYFNQKEAEYMKLLGLQTARLGDAEQGSESTGKRLQVLEEEVETYKAQVKSLKTELEDQERSLKSQNAQLERKQHEAWVAMRQEARKSADAQKELQGLRTRLTLAETKLVEKEVEIASLKEENLGLRESIEKISQQQQQSTLLKADLFSNGNGQLASGPSSIASDLALPPELPPLPILPPLLAMAPPPLAAMPPPHLLASSQRPPTLGRKSPPRGTRGYSRSPSPPGPYPRYNRDISPARSDRSRSHYDSYDEDRCYSPLSPHMNYSAARGQHSREWSPDRYSTRSERSDYSGSERDHHPPHHHDNHHRGDRDHRHPSREDAYLWSSDNYNNHHLRLKDKRVDDKRGPKTSSPMVDP